MTMDTIVRALSLYQPYASLMLHGKIETRPYPTRVRGKVLICSCKEAYSRNAILRIGGQQQYSRINEPLGISGGQDLNTAGAAIPLGQAIAIADLVDCRPMTPADADACFVQYREPWEVTSKKTGQTRTVRLYCWIFENVQPIEPFSYKGSQGWTILSAEITSKIKIRASI